MKASQTIYCTVTNDLSYDQRMIRICTALARQGYQITLVGRQLPQSIPLRTQVFQQRRLSCFFNKGKWFYLEFNLRLFFFLLFKKWDAVCSIDLDTIMAGATAARLRSRVCVYDAHEYFTEVPEVVERPRIQKIWRWIERKTVPRLTHCYTVCESLAELFSEQYKVPFAVIRNVPFALDLPALPKRAQPPVLLYQGALNDGRGLPEIIETMNDIEDAVLWLVGEGDLSEQLRIQVAESDLTQKVIFWGYQIPEKLKELTTQATIGLNLLENKGLNYYYSLANKAFDYVQAGIPAIHMDFPEYQKLNAAFEIGVLVKDLKRENLLPAIQKLLKDQAFYHHLQQNCLTARQEWTWEKEEQRLIAFYEGVFSEK